MALTSSKIQQMALTSTSGNRSKIRHFMKQKWPCILTCNLDIGVPGRSNLEGAAPCCPKKFSFLKKKCHRKIFFLLQKNKKSRQNFGPKFGNFARIYGVLPEFFQNWGGCRPPSPLGKYAYDPREAFCQLIYEYNISMLFSLKSLGVSCRF